MYVAQCNILPLHSPVQWSANYKPRQKTNCSKTDKPNEDEEITKLIQELQQAKQLHKEANKQNSQ